MMDFATMFDSFSTLKVGVVGDLMLDTYLHGQVDRISPEAPVPIVSLQEREHRIGGAGNVALNIASLGATVSLLSVIGDDEEGKTLAALLQQKNISTTTLVSSKNRITTSKTRILSRHQQMMRVDNEQVDDLTAVEGKELLAKTRQFIETEKPAIIILEDYNKGVLGESMITEVIALCKRHNVLTAVDPKRKNFFAYQQVDIFKPNLKEVKEALNLLHLDVNTPSLKNLHKLLAEKLQHDISLITLSDKGIFYGHAAESRVIDSHVRDIADVSGAGDTVIAVAALVYAATRNVHLMASVANLAGGLVCEEVGTIAINRNKLLSECQSLLKYEHA